MATITLDKAKQLCTAAELQLIKASRRSASASPGVPRLKAEVLQARKLRDKWRDVHEKQRRAQQIDSRETPGEARSRQKAELFAESLRQLEEQLKQAEKSPTAGRSAPQPVSRPPKKVRSQTHRQDRSQIRKELEMKREKMASQKPTKATASPKKQSVKKAPPKPVVTKVTGTKATKAVAPKLAKKKAAATKSVATSAPKKGRAKGSGTAAKATLGLQFNATAAAKNDRVKISGLTTRTRGHISARGKRKQAARDHRN
jgi:hypothetical protein